MITFYLYLEVLPSCYFNIKIASYVLNPGQCFKSKLEQFTFSLHILGRTKVIIAIITLDGRKRLAPVYYLLYVYVLIACTR